MLPLGDARLLSNYISPFLFCLLSYPWLFQGKGGLGSHISDCHIYEEQGVFLELDRYGTPMKTYVRLLMYLF